MIRRYCSAAKAVRCTDAVLVLMGFAACSAAPAAEFLVADQANARIVAFDAETGAFTRTVVSTGLLQPAALAIGPGGDLYVADLAANAVLKVDPESGATTTFASGITSAGSLLYDPVGDTLFVGEYGQFPVVDGNEVFRYAADGMLLAGDTIDAGPTGHAGLAFDAAGDLYVSSFGTDMFLSGQVLKYGNPNGPNPLMPLGVFAPSPSPSPLLQGAAGLAFDDAGNLFVAGLLSNGVGQLVKFTVEDGAVTGETAFDPNIAFPSAVLSVPGGPLIVTSLGTGEPGAIYKYDPDTGVRTHLLLGDFDGNAASDAADFAAWTAAFGQDGSADADGDGDTDGDDYLAWQQTFGAVGPPGESFSPAAIVLYDPSTSAAVPEPAAAWLSAAAAAGFAMRRRLAPIALRTT